MILFHTGRVNVNLDKILYLSVLWEFDTHEKHHPPSVVVNQPVFVTFA